MQNYNDSLKFLPNDLLAYSKSATEYMPYLQIENGKLRTREMYAKISKCKFCSEKVNSLQHILTTEPDRRGSN